MPDIIIHKTCTKCNFVKNITDFPLETRKGKKHRLARCSDCMNTHVREYYERTKGRRAEMRRARYLKDDRAAWKALKAIQKVPFTREWYEYKWRSLKNSSRHRGIAFSLNTTDVRRIYANWSGDCPYCRRKMQRPSVDRIDNNLGYEAGNCILVCYGCNVKKTCMSPMQILGAYQALFGDKPPSEILPTLDMKKHSIPLIDAFSNLQFQ